MGFFSWRTSDTNESVSNIYSNRGAYPCKMITPTATYYEENYEGYGVFGGVDFYEEVAKLNGLKTREDGIFIDKEIDTILPKIVSYDCAAKYEDLPDSEDCEYQGYFYPIPLILTKRQLFVSQAPCFNFELNADQTSLPEIEYIVKH